MKSIVYAEDEEHLLERENYLVIGRGKSLGEFLQSLTTSLIKNAYIISSVNVFSFS